jgi:hypothetical protein
VLLFGVPALLVSGIVAVALFGAAAGPLSRSDVLAAGAVTLLAGGVMALHQFSVGNLGPASDSERCSNFCQDKGFTGSSMPPRNTGQATCSCVDAQGREALTVPLAATGGSAKR